MNKVVELFYQIWLITNMYWGCFMLENTVKLSALTKWHDTHIKMTLFLFDGLGIHVILGGTESTQDRLIRLANCITHKRSSGRCPSFIFPLIMQGTFVVLHFITCLRSFGSFHWKGCPLTTDASYLWFNKNTRFLTRCKVNWFQYVSVHLLDIYQDDIMNCSYFGLDNSDNKKLSYCPMPWSEMLFFFKFMCCNFLSLIDQHAHWCTCWDDIMSLTEQHPVLYSWLMTVCHALCLRVSLYCYPTRWSGIH